MSRAPERSEDLDDDDNRHEQGAAEEHVACTSCGRGRRSASPKLPTHDHEALHAWNQTVWSIGREWLHEASIAGTARRMRSLRLRQLLDAYYEEVRAVILCKQSPLSGLLPASTAVNQHGNYHDAWVRDNVYSILAVWGLGLAYRQLDDDRGRGFELEQRTIQLMRGLLRSMMAQASKVETFKVSRLPQDALHAKYDTETGAVVVGDMAWGHLQLDATSLYLLMLAQMIRSGLTIIGTLDEVTFVQNLVYYIERAYRTPDYGIWERGAKSNQGSVELNASSLGMAKAALEALSGFNLFGAKGGQSSVVHVSPDNIAQADLTLSALLPRESNTKEIDAALLSIVGYPAFAVSRVSLEGLVRGEILQKLEGRFGLKRFLRDGHQTVLEAGGRLHYEPSELKRFEHIESEWPLFWTYLFLDALMSGNTSLAREYEDKLASVTVEVGGHRLLPELYFVPSAGIEAERARPHSQSRLPNDNVPLVWAQSLYLLGRMIRDGVLKPGDIDPLDRRHRKRPRRPVVQIVLLAEDEDLQAELAAHGVESETMEDIAPVLVYLPDDIVAAYGEVGRNARLGLSGRTARALKTLTTSRIFILRGHTVVCLASFFLPQDFFLVYDLDLIVDRFRSEIAYLHRNWSLSGRPIVTVLLTRQLLDTDRTSFYSLMRRIAIGEVDSIPVRRGRLAELMPTACFERIDDLNDLEFSDTPWTEIIERPLALAKPGQEMRLETAKEREIELATTPEPLLERLSTTDNLYEQIELLGGLERFVARDAVVAVRGAKKTYTELVEEVYRQAGRRRLWAVVRQAAGLLNKVDGDLGIALGAILVSRKNIQVGRAYSDESLITQPIQEDELLAKVNTFCRDDVRERVLTQELILYLSLLIKARPELFEKLITIRVSQLISLITSQIVRRHRLSTSEAYEHLMSLAPSVIQRELEMVLSQYHTLEALPQELERLTADNGPETLDWHQNLGLETLETPVEGWLAWRQYHGVIDRQTAAFYEGVWSIFRHVPSLVIGDKVDRRNCMESSVVLSDMTPGEPAFALWIEHLLNKIPAAEYRQLNVESLNVLAGFFRHNPTLHINDGLSLDVLIGHAVRLAYVEGHPEHEAQYSEHKPEAWESFYALSPAATSERLVGALRHLLKGSPRLPERVRSASAPA